MISYFKFDSKSVRSARQPFEKHGLPVYFIHLRCWEYKFGINRFVRLYSFQKGFKMNIEGYYDTLNLIHLASVYLAVSWNTRPQIHGPSVLGPAGCRFAQYIMWPTINDCVIICNNLSMSLYLYQYGVFSNHRYIR